MYRALVALALTLSAGVSSGAATAPVATETAAAEAVAGDTAAAQATIPEARPSAAPVPTPAADVSLTRHPLVDDWPLAGRQYAFSVAGQAVAGALGFYIGSGIETAIQGEKKAHKGWLSFTAIRYDNFKGAFWGGAIGGLLGSSLTTYFVGQMDEEDGGLFWTVFGATAMGAGAAYLATQLDVNKQRDWKPFIPLLALPSIGGVAGFHVSRWFSDRKRESIVGSEATARAEGLHWHMPRLGLGAGAYGDAMLSLQAVNLTF